MLALFFLIAGIYMISKQEVKISSKKSIKGPVARKIGLIFIAPALLSFATRLFPQGLLSIVLSCISLAGYVVAIISIFYFVFFYKPSEKDDVKHT